MSFWKDVDDDTEAKVRSNSSELQELRDKITELRKFVLCRLEEALDDAKELRSMWKMRIRKLEERESPKEQLQNRRVLGQK